MRHVYVLALAALAACGDDPITELTATAMPVSTPEDTAKVFEIEANLPVAVQVTTAPMHGALTGDGTTWTYTPEANYNGADAVTVLVSAGADSIELAIPITVTPVNDAPVANPDTFPTNADTPLTLDVGLLLLNDTDLEGETLSVTAVSNALQGGAVLNGNEITFTPTLSFAGNATFDYTVSDGDASSTGTVTVSVGVDQAPIAIDDSATTAEDTPLALSTATLLTNDSDPDGHIISITEVSNPQNCTVVKSGTTITVTPTANSNLPATFEYKVSDGALDDTGVVTVTVTAVPDAPVAGPDTAATTEDTPVQIDAATLLQNDTDGDGDPLTITSVTGAVLANGIVTFTPAANQNGDVTFSYTIADGTGLSATGTVTVTVAATPDAPTAVADTLTIAEDGAGSVDVFANDSDADGDPLTLQSSTQPAHGVVTFVGPIATYTPVADFTGLDSFTYTISDGNGGTATGTVTVDVTPVNDAPIAIDDTVPVVEETATVINALANDTDVDLDALAITAATQPLHGTTQLAGGIVTYTPALDFVGADGFDYTISDGKGGTDVGHVNLVVGNVNDAPVARPDTLGTDENTPVSANVVLNDTDADGDTLTVQSFTQGAKGGGVAFNGGVVTYTPTLDFSDTDTFTYTISDGNGGTSTTTVTVFVGLDNDPPVAVDDTATVAEETTATIGVLGNDTDIDGNTLSVTAVTAPEHGQVTLVAGVITYRPSDNYFGPDAFDYVINDGFGGTDIGHVDITVTNINDVPIAVNDTLTTNEDTFAILNVTLNDTDIDGDTLEIDSSTQPAHGTVVFIATDARYTPAANYNGPDSFTYTVTDGNGGTATATVNITVTAINDAPVAGDDTQTVVEETATAVPVLGNDNDVDGDTIVVASVGTAQHGTVTLVAGTITYTPDVDFFGPDGFNYVISDGKGGTDTGRANINVTNVNDAPVAANDTLSTNEDTAKSLNVASNDSDVDGDTLTIQSFTQPLNGSVTFTGTTATFTPSLNFNGTTSFTYTIKDPSNTTSTATVNVTVIAVNDKPNAVNDAFSTNEDTQSSAFDLLNNDTDVDIGQTLTVTSNTNPAHGTLVRTGSSVRYTPALNYNGPDAFNYTISDGNGGTDTATVSITVTAVNDAPDAVNDAITTNEDTASSSLNLVGNDSDVDTGQTLTVTSNTNPLHGSVVRTGNSVVYTPAADYNGPDAFQYTISDGNGGSDTATVSVTVVAVNDAPVANADSITANEDATGSVNVVTNDTDVDGDVLTLQSFTQPATGGTVAFAGTTATFTPTANFNGSTSFTYTIKDPSNATSTATVSVTVTAVPDAPVAVNDTLAVDEDSSATINVTTNDSDADGDTLNIQSFTQGAKGSVSFTGRIATYTPNPNLNGSDSFQYTINDGTGRTATATVTVTIAAKPDLPVAQNDTFSIAEDAVATIVDVKANDSDADGDTIAVTAVGAAAHGTTTLTAGVVRYAPAADFNGSDSFTYTITANGDTASATVTVTVTPVPDAPKAVADAITVDEDDDATVVGVTGNDSDADGDAIAVTAVGAAAHGTAALAAGVVTYKPAADFNGTDSFTYTITANGDTASATVTVTVNPVPDAPKAVNDTKTVAEDANATTIDVKANDTDADGDAITVTQVSDPANGTTTLVNGVVTYKPDADFNGTDTFTYQITAAGDTASATVTVTVTPVPDALKAVDDTFNNVTAGTTDLDVLANDSDPDGATITLANITQQPANGAGTVSIAGGKARYVVAANFSGTATFTYQISAPAGRTATATATITVTASNQTPTADGTDASSFDGFSTTVFLSGSDPENTPLTFEIVSGPAGGSLGTIAQNDDATATVDWDPSGFVGNTSFTYRVKDAGGLFSAPATVTLFAAGCGDGTVSSDISFEECDDGNQIDGDGCDNDCRFTCGSNGDNLTPVAVAVDPVTGHCFARYSETGDFSAASERCETMPLTKPGHIPTVRSAGEQAAISQVVGGGQSWLGATDQSKEGKFIWVTGEPYTFTSFLAGQPDGGQIENCIASEKAGWLDEDCEKQFELVCEYNDDGVCGDGELNPGEECDDDNDNNGDGCENDCSFTCGTGTGALSAVVDPVSGHCFASYNDAVDWDGANAACGGQNRPGAHLATALDSGESDAILKTLQAVPSGGAWIGGHANPNNPAELLWVTGEEFTFFDAFAVGEPNHLAGDECVLAATVGWADVPCDLGLGLTGTVCEFEGGLGITAFQSSDVLDNLVKTGTLTRPVR